MAQRRPHRDFTPLKAVLLVALMAVTLLMGEMPHPVSGSARIENPVTERAVPALFGHGLCDEAKTVSV